MTYVRFFLQHINVYLFKKHELCNGAKYYDFFYARKQTNCV